MKIPKRFKIFGQTITVEMKSDLFHDTDLHGSANYRKNLITLQSIVPEVTRSQSGIEHDFCHELAHFLLYYAGGYYGKDKEHLHRDEHLVDILGGLIHQVFDTMEYEKEANR